MTQQIAEARTGRAHEGLFHGLLHDAAIFPPGDAPVPEAVAAHRDWRQSRWSPFVGPFISSLARCDEVAAQLTPASPLATSLTLGGPADLEAAGARARTERSLHIVSVEVPAGSGRLSEIRQGSVHLPRAVALYVELPYATAGSDTMELLVKFGMRLKVRTGGLSADAFPTDQQLARVIWRAVRAEVAFKLTAGLHEPVRHRDPSTGFEHHGFLNVIHATARALVGGNLDEVASCLANQDGDQVAAAVASLDAPLARGVRRRFDGFGTCSIAEPITGLLAHGLVQDLALDA